MAAHGFLRLPAFLNSFVQTIKEEQIGRTEDAPILLNPERTINDAILASYIAIFSFLLRILLQKRLSKPLFKRFSRKIRSKLSENLFYSIYYMISFGFFALVVLPQSDWNADLLSNSANIVRQLVYPFPAEMSKAEHILYSQSAGFYLSALAFLFLFDGRRSDFGELVLHHVVTISLVGVSYAYSYVRFGIVVIALHDFGDIFLYFAKFLHYLGMAGWDTLVFAVFAATFYVTRLVMFSRLVYSILAETLQTIVEEPSFNRWAMFYETYLVHYVFFVVFLTTLLVLHCFWFALILRMIYREVVLNKKVSDEGDIRSDDEESDEEIGEEKKTS